VRITIYGVEYLWEYPAYRSPSRGILPRIDVCCCFLLAIGSRAESICIKSIRRRAKGGEEGARDEKEVRKCPRENVGIVRAYAGYARERASLWRRRVRGKKGRERRERRMLFRTAKLNYQIKQQRRYINKIDFARRSSKGKRPVVVSRLTSFRATPDLIRLHD